MQRLSSSHSSPCCSARPSGWRGTIIGIRLPMAARPRVCAHAVDESGSSKSKDRASLSALDSLLGQPEADGSAPASSGEKVVWWSIKPKQAAPPRKTGMAPGSHGRFVMSEDFLKLGELRAGGKTLLGSQIEIPRVQPILSFVLLIINVAVYGTYVNIGVLQGPGAALDFLSGLWLHPSQLLQDLPTQVAHAGTAMFLAPGPCELAVTLWSLAFVAPRAEAVMGYVPFLSTYLLCGVAGGLTQLSLMHEGRYALESLGACGASAALWGLLGVLLVHHTRNWRIESEAASWRPDPPAASSSSRPGSRSGGQQAATRLQEASTSQSAASQQQQQQPTRQQANQQQLLVQAVSVGVASLALAAMQALEGHPSDPGGGAGLWGEVAWGLGVGPQLAGLVTGMLLCAGMGPSYSLQREVHIPDGSMSIPDLDEVQEMVVVLDRTTSVGRLLTAASFTAALLGTWSLALP